LALVTPPACPLADLARADIADIAAATTAAAAEDDDDTETDDRPGSLSKRTCTHPGSKLSAPPTTGKPNVWLSGLLNAPSLPSTSDVSPRRTAPVVGGELGICPRTSSMLDREAPPMVMRCVHVAQLVVVCIEKEFNCITLL
jgi:hypothetical protein